MHRLRVELALPHPRLPLMAIWMPRGPHGLVSLLTIAVVMFASLGACAGVPLQLSGTEFVSVAVTDGGAPRPLAPGTSIRLKFDATKLSGNAGCNGFGGDYSIDGGRLRFEGFGMTAMGCDPERDAQDVWVLQLLASRPAISLVGSELTLTSGSITMTFRDREVVEPDAPLVGPVWTVESIISGDAVSSVPGGLVATIAFHDGGGVDVDTSCNRGSGTWSTVSGGIEVGPLMLTKMACMKDPATLESAVLAVLGAGTITTRIDGQLLTLQAGRQGLVLRAAPGSEPGGRAVPSSG